LCRASIICIFFFIIIAEKKAFAERQFYIERPKLAAELSYNLESDVSKGPFGESRYLSHAFMERLEIETKGWAYHPAFVLYTLKLSPEWDQTLEKPDAGGETSRSAFRLYYSLEMTLLKYKRYTMTLFARRSRSVLTNSFGGRSEVEGNTYGATLGLKYRALPTTLSYTHAASNYGGFYKSKETRDDIRLYMRHQGKNNDTKFKAAYSDRERIRLETASDVKSLSGDLQNTYRITPDNRILLSSGLAFMRSEADFSTVSSASLSEALNWRHTKNLSSYYNLNYSIQRLGDSQSDSKSAGAGLSHSLYENLTTSASVGASDDSYGGDLNVNYRRSISIPHGAINLSAGHNYRVTYRTAGEAFLQVLDESHVLSTGDVTSLNNRNVDLDSIVITNADHTIIYVKDIDYTIETMGTSVRLSRTYFGAIADGDPVLASYTYLSNPVFDSSAFGQSYGLGLNLWSVWSINYGYSHSQEYFLSGIPPETLGSSTTQTVDSGLDLKWSVTTLHYEDLENNSGISNSRWFASENLKFKLRDNLFLGISGNYGETTLKDKNETDKFYGVKSSLQWKFSRWASLSLEGNYSRSDGISKKTEGKGGSALIQWFYGILSGDISYRFVNEEDLNSGQKFDGHSLLLRIRRAMF